MDVTILLFDGFDELDAIGPYEVFQSAARYGADSSASLVTLEPTDRVTARNRALIEPHGTLEEETDLLLVPGGGWSDGDSPGVRREYDDGAIPETLAAYHERGIRVGSVCTGSLLLAGAGLLEGQPATTHHTALEDLGELGADVREERVVDNGGVVMAAGVTSGIDLALYLLDREHGAEVADSVARELEHERAI